MDRNQKVGINGSFFKMVDCQAAKVIITASLDIYSLLIT